MSEHGYVDDNMITIHAHAIEPGGIAHIVEHSSNRRVLH